MSLEEKIGQLFVAPICPLRQQAHYERWIALNRDFGIGNAIVERSYSAAQINALNRLQTAAKYPLLVVADAEWGLGMRLSDTISYPKNGQLDSADLATLQQLGEEIARQARLVGIHMNLAPVVDVNTNPENPIIGIRSFGSDPDQVGKRGAAVIAGYQKQGLLACAKHFPGHGDTTLDSHLDLPRIDHPIDRINQVELPPFIDAINARVSTIMTAHILVPALDPDSPATLSTKILTDLLRGKLRFSGLIITDALNMRALSDRYSPEEIALRAHAAGADLLLYGELIEEIVDEILDDTIPRAYAALLQAYRSGQFPIERLDQSVQRILQAKESVGLFSNRMTMPDPPLNTPEALALKEQLLLTP